MRRTSIIWIVSIVLACVFPLHAQEEPPEPTVIDFEQFTAAPSLFTGADPPITIGIATFSGGQVLSAATFLPADRTVVYGTAATSERLGTTCPGCQPVITMDFAEPIADFNFLLLNGNTVTVSYIVQDDQGALQVVTLPPNFQSGAATIVLPTLGIRQVTATGSEPEWDFLVDNLSFFECSVTATPNENCNDQIGPRCSANIVLANGSETTEIFTRILPPRPVEVDLQTDFGEIQDPMTDSSGRGSSNLRAGTLAFRSTTTEIADLSAHFCGKQFDNLSRVFNYHGFDFHRSIVSDADFTNSTALDADGIQAFFELRNSFLARFILVRSGGGFLDINGNEELDEEDTIYAAPTGTPQLGARGISAAELIAHEARRTHVNPKVLIATMQKEKSIVTVTFPTLPSAVDLNRAMGCDRPRRPAVDFASQVECGANTFRDRFRDRTFNERPLVYPFFIRATDGIDHFVTGLGPQAVGFEVETASAYAQYRYTNHIQSMPNGGGVYLFEEVWRFFGF